MQTELLTALENKRQQNPERFSRSIYAFADVHDSTNGEWIGRLEEMNRNSIGPCIVLFGYQINANHWIGMFFKIRADEQIDQAYFIDPLYSSEFNPTEIQKQFSLIYPNVTLQSKKYEQTDDRTQSATMSVNNLLRAIEETDFPDSSSPSEGKLSFVINLRITEKYLQNMHDDFRSMPNCIERSILSLQYYALLKSMDSSQLLNYKIQILDEIDTEIANEFRNFEQYLQFEEFNFPENKRLVSLISTSIKSEIWRSAIDELKTFLKQIRPLNVCELFRLVDKANAAAELIKGKKIVFLLGFTGAGKSTMIHFLAGSLS